MMASDGFEDKHHFITGIHEPPMGVEVSCEETALGGVAR
jgi:hypothetical protein